MVPPLPGNDLVDEGVADAERDGNPANGDLMKLEEAPDPARDSLSSRQIQGLIWAGMGCLQHSEACRANSMGKGLLGIWGAHLGSSTRPDIA